MSPFQGFIPHRVDLFDRAMNSFHSTLTAIGSYKSAITSAIQNPGVLVDDAVLQTLYGEYLKCRGALLMAFQGDIPFMDQLFSEIMAAIQTTQDQEPPSEPVHLGAELFQVNDPEEREGKKSRPSPTSRLNYDGISNADCLDALQTIDETLDLLPTLPDAAADFADSVEQKLTSMREGIIGKGRATEKQIIAIENMQRGALKWTDHNEYD